MNLDNLNKWLAFIANFAVIVGIVFLAIETRQNVQATRAQTAQALFEQLIQERKDFGEVPTAIGLTNRGFDGLNEQEENEAIQTYNNLMLVYDNAFYQYRQGTLDEELFERYRSQVERRVAQPYFNDYWERSKLQFSLTFVDFVEGLIRDQNYK